MHGRAKLYPLTVLDELRHAAQRILDLQDSDGSIPWFEDGPWDPWNHVECAMALGAMGHKREAAAAYDYLFEHQREDGSWLGEYGNALPMVDRDFISREKAPALCDTNFCAYPAVGIAHYLDGTRDVERVRGWWPMVMRAIDFVLSLQRADGTISWSLEASGSDEDDALLAGNASIAKSLECAIFLADTMGQNCNAWRDARARLVAALQAPERCFDQRRTGARFAMDWYYPVLAGVLSPAQARERLNEKWSTFVEPATGCRCVLDEPWVTIAESAELVMALLVAGDAERASDLFDTILDHRDKGGAFWMGWQMEEQIVWPREQPSWTQAAVILAADALERASHSGAVLTRSLL